MLKSKNELTLFVNYSYNSFYDFCFSENSYREQKVMCQKYGIFDFIWGLYMDIPLTDIHAIGPAIYILYQL